MSDDEADPELLALLRQSLGLGPVAPGPAETGVLKGAEHVYNNAIDVALDSQGTRAAAGMLWTLMEKKGYSTRTWSAHELHPKAKDESTVDFIFTMDLLNFSFWSERDAENIPITSSDFWQNEAECTEEVMAHIFRSATDEQMPLLPERLACLREAGTVLYNDFNCRFSTCISRANGSAAALVNLVVEHFPSFRDEVRFEGRTVRLLKRAQILVADLWACFDGTSYGTFHDIDSITAFADYRVPQMLHHLGVLTYSPPLLTHIQARRPIPAGSAWETQLRGCAVWAVELLRREIVRRHPEAKFNAVLIDFFLYDTVKEREGAGKGEEGMVAHHRTRSIRY
ncbi:MAG: hypothetical protein M1832_003675 [Thelocarpon impressellum]|nr:MAG: hypothetical protein M1832_003675 [Thelocarpon impressellum]